VKAAQDLVLDRVCRTYVPLASTLTARVAGREEHFCSTACRDRALAEVARAS
jgi:YHS domain-containing protein